MRRHANESFLDDPARLPKPCLRRVEEEYYPDAHKDSKYIITTTASPDQSRYGPRKPRSPTANEINGFGAASHPVSSYRVMFRSPRPRQL